MNYYCSANIIYVSDVLQVAHAGFIRQRTITTISQLGVHLALACVDGRRTAFG